MKSLLTVFLALLSTAVTAQGIPCALCPWEVMGSPPARLTDAQAAQIAEAAMAMDREQFRTTLLAKFSSAPQRFIFDANAPGCSAKSGDGKPLKLSEKSVEPTIIPRGATFSASCLIEAQQ